MRITRLAAFRIVCCAALLGGCRTSVVGHYTLDLEETKRCVEQTAAEYPVEASSKDSTIQTLAATDLDVELDEAGKVKSTTVLKLNGMSKPMTMNGTWQLEGKRVTIKVEGSTDTLCDVDGKRLRCEKDSTLKLYGRYVLVRKS